MQNLKKWQMKAVVPFLPRNLKLHSPYEICEDKSSTIIVELQSMRVLMFNLYSFKIQKLSMHDDMLIAWWYFKLYITNQSTYITSALWFCRFCQGWIDKKYNHFIGMVLFVFCKSKICKWILRLSFDLKILLQKVQETFSVLAVLFEE